MPKLKRPIPETDQGVVRSIAIAVIQEILIDRMGLPSTMKINYPGFTDAAPQPHGFISNKTEPARFPTTDNLFIDVSESYIEPLLQAAVTSHPEQIPLFLNRALELEVRPIYASVEMRITVRYRAKGKTDARRFYDLMMMRVFDREDMWLHELSYSFGIPDVFMAILEEIHRKTESNAGYGEDFETFFAKWVNPRYGLLSDQVGKNTIGVFSDTQDRCIGYFDLDTQPDFGSKKSETEEWEIEFPYVVRYEKPKDVWLSYPIVIHNQVLSDLYRNRGGMKRYTDTQSTRTWSMQHMKRMEAGNDINKYDQEFPGRYFPLFDEFMPRMVPQNSRRLFTTLTLLPPPDDADPLLLMEFADLENPQYGMVLSQCIKEFLVTEAPWITRPGQSALHLGLYAGRELMDPSFITLDEGLKVRSTRPLSQRQYYHVRLGIVTDFTYINPAAQLRLRQKPCAFIQILDYIMPPGLPRPVPLIVGGVVTDPSYEDISENLHGRRLRTSMKTVQYTTANAVYTMKK